MSHFADEERIRKRRENSGTGKNFGKKRLRTNTYLGSLTSRTKRDFEEGKRFRKKKTSDKYIFGKSHFADEERLRGKRLLCGRRETSEAEGRIHIWEVSLRRRRETSEAEGRIHIRKSHFADEERLRRRKEISGKKDFGEKERFRDSLIL